MSKGLIITLGIFGAIALVCMSLFGTYVSYYDHYNAAERGIVAQYEENQNIYSNYTLKVQEVAQVPGMYTADLTAVVTAALEGRYGEDGSQAVFQWIQEQNPTVDSALYVQIQRIMEAGRNEFKNGQTQLIDKKRAYETDINSFWGGFWARFTGYPKINLDDYKVVKSEQTNETFDSGVDRGVQLPQR